MYKVAPNEKQKLSFSEKYRQYLSVGPVPTDKLHNKYNVFDDLNSTDNALMKEAMLYLHRSKEGGGIT